MEIVVICSEAQKLELTLSVTAPLAGVTWLDDISHLSAHPGAAAFFDLLYDGSAQRLAVLAPLASSALVVVNSVVDTLSALHPGFVRIAGWPTMLSASVIEAAGDDAVRSRAEEVFAVFGRRVQWVPDIAGFITPRVIASIINEAYFALGDGVSSPDDIDTAMKLGTAYPYGPLEWADRIGLRNIAALLETLGKTHPRYAPSEQLLQKV